MGRYVKNPVLVAGSSTGGSNVLPIGTTSQRPATASAGAIRYQGQTHSYAKNMPTTGNHEQGNIVWNSEPEPGRSLGWVCVKSGAPGTWCEIGNVSPI